MVTPTDSSSSYRNRGSGHFVSSFEKSSVKGEMKSSGNNDRSTGTYDGVQRSSWNGVSSTSEPIGSEVRRRGPSSQSASISMSPGRNKRGAKIVTNVNTTNKMESASFASRKNDQWNVKRDIPAGTVRNNPFLPQPKPKPPQLHHQKRQWDTSNIPRGSVAARILESDSPRSKGGGNTPISPSKITGGSNGRPSPSSTSPRVFSHDGHDRLASLTSESSRSNEREKSVTSNTRVFSPRGGSSSWQTKSFSVSPEQKNMQQQSSQPSHDNNEKREKVIKNRSEPSREVPTVKARVSTMYKETKPTETSSKLEYTKAKTVAYHQSVRGTAAKKTMSVEDVKIDNGTDDDNDEDPWIIPERNTATAQVFAGDWGEAVVPAKSAESDDWETPAKDWIRSGESQMASFLNEAEQKSSTSQKANFHHPSFHNQQQHNTSGIRDGDEMIPQSAKEIVPVSDDMIGARVQPLQARRAIDGFQDGNSRKALDRTTNRNVAPVLAPPPKDANTYHQSQGRVSKNRMKEDVEAIGTKSSPSSSQAFDNSFEHFSTKTGMISSISADDAKLESSFGKSRDQHVHSGPVSSFTSPSTIRAKQIDLDTKIQENKKQLKSSDAFGFPQSSHEMNGNEKVRKDIGGDEFFGAASSDNSCDRSRINERNYLSRRPSSTMSYNSSKIDEDEDEEGCDSNDESNTLTGDSKKKKKGFFKGLFGRKNKEKDNSKNKETTKDKKNMQNRRGRSNSKSSFTDSMTMDDPHFEGNSRSFNNSHAQTNIFSSQTGRQPGNLNIDTIVDHSTQEKNHSEDLKGRENHVMKGKSEDDATFSDMANPSAFKDMFCPPSTALKERMVPALSTIGDIPDESFTTTVSPVKSIVARDSNSNDIEPENPSGVTLSETTEVDAFVDPELDHLDIDMEIDSEEDENMIAPPSKSMLMAPPPPPPPPPRKQRKSATSSVRQGSIEETSSSQKDSNEILQNTEEIGEEKAAVENQKSTFDSETMADKAESRNLRDRTKENSSSQNDMNKSDPLLQEMAEGDYSPTVTAQTQEDSDKTNPVLLHDHSRGKVPSETGTKEDNNQDRTTLRGTSPSRNVPQRDLGRQRRIKDTSPAQTILRGVSPSRNVVKLAGQARIRNISPGRKNSKMISRGVSPARNVAKLTGRMRIRDTTSPGRVDTQESIISRGTSPARNALKLPDRVKLRDTSPARKEKTQESIVKGARTKFSSPASRNLRDSSPARNNVEPTKNRFSKSSLVPQKTQLGRSSLQTRQSAQVHSHQSLIIPKGHSVEETNIPSRYRKKTAFNNVQSIPIATHSSGYARHLVSRKARNVVTRSPRSSFSSQTSQDLTDENGKQSKKFSKANHAYRSIVVKKNRSEDVEDNRKYLSIPESSTSASDLSCSSSTYDTYQKKLADSLRKANIGTQSSAEYSVHSHRSLDDSSIESDIRILRSILRRPRLDRDNENVITASRKIEGFPTYDEESSTDPMQRVGLRLLSTAIIPIQTEVRRFLAMRHALTRMWALIVVQTYTRNFLAKKHYRKELNSITVIQATFRGHRARNYIIDKHICAIEIQRFVRGYLATMKVYEDIYKVTLVQSLVRKRIAMDYADYRMALVIQLQAAARGFLVRRRRSHLDASATVIASCWRCFYNRLTYQFDLLDIIIVQSLWRKKLGIRAAARKFVGKQNSAAIIIQAKFRQYDARMDLLCYLATRVVQTKWRCYFLRKRYAEYQAATMIASLARMWQVRNDFKEYKNAAIIQSVVRMFSCRTDYVEFQNATIIQSVVRMRQVRNDFRFDILDIIIVQSLWRKKLGIRAAARKFVEKQNLAAIIIQAKFRQYDARMDLLCYLATRVVQTKWRCYFLRKRYVEYQAATMIASIARMWQVRNDFKEYKNAAIIQSVVRMFSCRTDYVEFQNAKIIQSVLRMWKVRKQFLDYQASTLIQTKFRSWSCRKDYISYISARKIQTKFRSWSCKKDYIFYISARLIQTNFRSSICRKDYISYISARKIQTNFRSSICRKDYIFYISARKIQTNFRSSICRKDYITFIAARTIQTSLRGYVCRKQYIENFASTMIQKCWRRYDCSSMYHRYCAARVISKTWRSYDCKMNYLHFLADILIVQSTIRRFLVQKQVKAMKNRAATDIQRIYRGYACLVFYTETVAATAIARTWRGFVCYADYEEFKAARKVQSIWRRHSCFAFYKEYKASRSIQSAWRRYANRSFYTRYVACRTVQSAFRRHVCQRKFKRVRSAVLIQSSWRGFVNYADHQEFLTVRKIQTAFRKFFHFNAYKRHVSSIKIQTFLRGKFYSNAYKKYIAARKIQCAWRGLICFIDYHEYLTVRRIQTVWRRYFHLNSHKRYVSAKKIQSIYRVFSYKRNYEREKSAIVIQSALRGTVCKREYKREKSAILIQSAWRGFLIYADYMFEVADIVVVQKQVRGWLARREANRRRYSKRNNAATTIAKHWRRFVNETKCTLIKYENRAATTIQKCWRRFWCFSNFIIALDCSIQIQAQMRCYLQKKQFAIRLSIIHEITKTSFEKGKVQSEAAIRIQRVFRGSLSRNALKVYLSTVKIQSRVRGAQARVAIKLYLTVRRIQTVFRGYTKRQKYASYIAARKIQATWRGCHLRQKYATYIAARKIQKTWRGHSPRRSYVAFIAARCIQNKWRYVKANQEVLVMRGEFLAASLIQNSWRGFVAYTDFVFTLSDIVAAQRIARGYLTRKKYSTIIRANVVRKKNELNGLILIQKIWRGFQARQNYWYTLGCTMQIQNFWRKQIVSHIIKKQTKAILMLQCFARRGLARQEYMQRRFVFLLIQTAEAERAKKIQALKVQEEVREDMEERQRDEAARVIQRFFLFVKHEVDQLLLATKQRKKWRKKMKVEKRTDDVEEALLEDVWLGLVARGNMEEEPFTRHYTNFGAGSVGEDSIAGSRVRKQQLRQPASSAVVGSYQYDDDDDTSEFSQLTGSTMAYAPHPTTSIRMIRKVDAIDMDDDFQLEEAFIDAEIHHAKERRHLAGNKSKKKDRSSSRNSVDYSQLDWKQGQRNINSHKANNNVSTMSHVLTMSNH